MMRLQYEITEEDYARMVEFQIRLKNRSFGQLVRYLLTNVGFGALAVYFFIARPDYPLPVRLTPFAMEAVLLALSTYPRIHIEAHARRAVGKYIKDGTLQKGYLGPHVLTVEAGTVKRRCGGRCAQADCEEVTIGRTRSGPLGLTLLVAQGVIFEAVPNTVLDRDGGRERLEEAIRSGREESWKGMMESARQRLEGECRLELSWELPVRRYLDARKAGFRYLYLTRCGWDSSQIIRSVILAYGIGVLASGISPYLGAAFTLLGLWLNRGMLLTMTPVLSAVAGKGIVGVDGCGVPGRAYLSRRQLVLSEAGRVQNVCLGRVSSIREAKGCIFLYTKEKAMLMLPGEAFRSGRDKDLLLALIRGSG